MSHEVSNPFIAGGAEYGRYRPDYPEELFSRLGAAASHHEIAWDCGTGSGQAAAGLARVFRRVIATDASAEQLANARPIQNVEYRQATAEVSSLSDASVDLVAAADAVHWFDLEGFYREVRRVVRPRGIIAVWCRQFSVHQEDAQFAMGIFHDLVRPHWPRQTTFARDGYRELPFPFEEIPSPPVETTASWSADSLLGYLGTWSSARRFSQSEGRDPAQALVGHLAACGRRLPERVTVSWAVQSRVGRV